MPNKKSGFASMAPAKRRAVQSKGGVNAHRWGRAHEWTEKEASLAGKIGGRVDVLKGRKKLMVERLNQSEKQ